ncbi:ABC transporter permease [Rufibacter tibetensis]|uniref:ABC transmembrane type-1 domain-containing protein n=1 Tax=Rufibacter tibetensis TaxID=512763 RepID=A0A0P0CZH5_9BACT|nr:ABC transporter permease subunit [Rufibacter tibetensis]ALJ00899.1 hypothetical protein DC20_20295 [Rufibacter tibetensis]
MNLASTWRSLSIIEKFSLIWFLLFSASALIAHVLTILGKEPVAYPEQSFLAPFESYDHLLGTDHLGRDLLFYLLLSCRSAWLLAIPPLVIATAFGILTGTSAAILGNTGLKISSFKLIILSFSLLLFFILHEPLVKLVDMWGKGYLKYFIYSGTFLLLALIAMNKLPLYIPLKKNLIVPVDEALQKIINVWSTLPKLLLLLVLSAFTPFSIYSLMGWICVTYWVLPARITRASVLQLREETYYETTKALGTPFQKVFIQFIWPSIKGPILTNFCFAASGLLGIGSTLAYLGIGIPPDVPSWGKLLANSRYSIDAWWTFVFPALLLLLSILSLQSIGNRFSSKANYESVTK